MENKYCPIMKAVCIEKKCMWYVTELNECAINTLAQATDSQANAFEELKNED